MGSNPEETKFCMLGALGHVGYDYVAEEALADAIPACHDRSIVCFNDAKRRRKKDVVKVFNKAIRSLSHRK